MAYTDNKGIAFYHFDGDSNAFTKKLSNNQYAGATTDDLADIAADNGGSLPSIVNAVEIDWNGAKIENAIRKYKSSMPEGQQNSYIFETSDLLDEMAAMRAQIDTLTDLVKGLYQALR